jgi:hypothetical protein
VKRRTVVHRSAFALLLAAGIVACGPRSTQTAPAPQQSIGASTPRAAVDRFLGAVRVQDLQAMSIIWGTANGPARDQMPQDQLERRELIMQCYLLHDQARIVRETVGTSGRPEFLVELTKGRLVRTTTFYAVQGPDDRWFVENVDLEPVQDLCQSPNAR